MKLTELKKHLAEARVMLDTISRAAGRVEKLSGSADAERIRIAHAGRSLRLSAEKIEREAKGGA